MRGSVEGLALVGVLGQGALMSFLLGKWPSERVTLEGAPEAEGFMWLAPLVGIDVVMRKRERETVWYL
jgi:hypothetical protein